MADDEQLGLLPKLMNQAKESMQVDVVQRGLHLVHHIERRRATAEDGEQVCERGQRPLATRQQRQLLHVLATRFGLDLDAGVEEVVRIGEDKAADATRE